MAIINYKTNINIQNLKGFKDNYLLRDSKTGELAFFPSFEDSAEFLESVEDPNNWYSPELWYADGAGFNGHISRLAFGTSNNISIHTYSDSLTNNTAEYMAIARASALCPNGSIILSDSLLAVNQINRTWKINNPNLKDLASNLWVIFNTKNLIIRHISRFENPAGIALEIGTFK